MAVPVKQAQSLADIPSISHGFYGRQGGVSKGQYSSLNAGIGSGDNPKHVRENRARIAQSLGTDAAHLLSNHQIHSTNVVTLSKAWGMNAQPSADAMVTNIAGIALSALSADCSPVLFSDSIAGVVGAAHAGWRGALAGVTDTTIAAMEKLGASRKNISAAIGPCLGTANFEVGAEFVAAFLSNDAGSADLFTRNGHGRQVFDIKTYLTRRLLAQGIAQVEALPQCTYATPDAYFSYRYNCHNGIGDYGCNISAIIINV